MLRPVVAIVLAAAAISAFNDAKAAASPAAVAEPEGGAMVGRQVEAGYGTTGGQGCVESVSKLSWRAYQSSTVS